MSKKTLAQITFILMCLVIVAVWIMTIYLILTDIMSFIKITLYILALFLIWVFRRIVDELGGLQ